MSGETARDYRRRSKSNRDWSLVMLGVAGGVLGQTVYDLSTSIINESIPSLYYSKWLAGLLTALFFFGYAHYLMQRSLGWEGMAEQDEQLEKESRDTAHSGSSSPE